MILPNYYSRSKSLWVGILIIIVLYIAILLFNCFIFYNYLVFLHMEGRIIDVYTRVTAESSHFFIPYDNEVSARYLKWVLSKTRKETKVIAPGKVITSKHIAVTYHSVTDPSGKFKEDITYIIIYKKSNFY